MNCKMQREVSLYYLNNMLKRPSAITEKAKRYLMDWVEIYAKKMFGMELASEFESEEEKPCKRPKIRRTVRALRAAIAKRGIVDITRRGYDKNLDMVFDVLKLAPGAQAVLRSMVYDVIVPDMAEMKSQISYSNSKWLNPVRIGLTLSLAEKELSSDGQLATKGIIYVDYDGDWFFSSSFKRMLKHFHRPLNAEKIRRIMVGKTATATLGSDNFKYVAEDYDHIRTLLENSLRGRRHGVNILLYGIPGTGKTEMCKAIARDAGAKLYMVSEDGENKREERLSDLLSARNLLEDDKDAVILFDEAEDIFEQNPFVENNNSKLFFNRMLEQNKTPVIWVSNSIKRMDSAYIRRFKYALQVEKPDNDAKLEIWKKICTRHRVKVPSPKIAEFVEKYDVPPALIDTAVDEASLRRFTFKVKYQHLKQAQVKQAFKHFFGVAVRSPLPQLSHLTPGDFAVVKAKRELLDVADTAELVKLLESEQSAKGIKIAKMGFA